MSARPAHRWPESSALISHPSERDDTRSDRSADMRYWETCKIQAGLAMFGIVMRGTMSHRERLLIVHCRIRQTDLSILVCGLACTTLGTARCKRIVGSRGL